VPFATVEKVLLLYQRKYAHLDPRSFHEKLSKKHAIDLSYEWVERALRESGLLSQARDPEARL